MKSAHPSAWTRATMHIPRKPTEQIKVDWAGQTMKVIVRISGEVYKAYLFVGELPYSQYTYVEAFLSQVNILVRRSRNSGDLGTACPG